MSQGYHLDPIDGDAYITQFDFETVYDSLDKTHQRPCPEHHETAEAVCKVLRWIVTMDPLVICRRRRALVAGRRAFVLAWMAVPGAVGHMTLRKLAAYLGTGHNRLAEIVARCQREFKFRSARQKPLSKVA